MSDGEEVKRFVVRSSGSVEASWASTPSPIRFFWIVMIIISFAVVLFFVVLILLLVMRIMLLVQPAPSPLP